jgi:hypothetical protein
MVTRPATWWERDERPRDEHGNVAVWAKGTNDTIPCPTTACEGKIVYNGNYFCENFDSGDCDWALPHPVRSKKDRAICDLIGIDYG